MANNEEIVHTITHAKVLFASNKPEIVESSKIRIIPVKKNEKLKKVTFTNKKNFKKEANVYACEVSRCSTECIQNHKHYGFRPIRILALGGIKEKI